MEGSGGHAQNLSALRRDWAKTAGPIPDAALPDEALPDRPAIGAQPFPDGEAGQLAKFLHGGGGRVAVLTGLAGSGQTAALQAALQAAPGFVFRAGNPLSSPLSLARLMLQVGAIDDGDDEASALLRALAEHASDDTPTVLSIEDAHTLEDDALLALAQVPLLRGASRPGLTLVLTGQPALLDKLAAAGLDRLRDPATTLTLAFTGNEAASVTQPAPGSSTLSTRGVPAVPLPPAPLVAPVHPAWAPTRPRADAPLLTVPPVTGTPSASTIPPRLLALLEAFRDEPSLVAATRVEAPLPEPAPEAPVVTPAKAVTPDLGVATAPTGLVSTVRAPDEIRNAPIALELGTLRRRPVVVRWLLAALSGAGAMAVTGGIGLLVWGGPAAVRPWQSPFGAVAPRDPAMWAVAPPDPGASAAMPTPAAPPAPSLARAPAVADAPAAASVPAEGSVPAEATVAVPTPPPNAADAAAAVSPGLASPATASDPVPLNDPAPIAAPEPVVPLATPLEPSSPPSEPPTTASGRPETSSGSAAAMPPPAVMPIPPRPPPAGNEEQVRQEFETFLRRNLHGRIIRSRAARETLFREYRDWLARGGGGSGPSR